MSRSATGLSRSVSFDEVDFDLPPLDTRGVGVESSDKSYAAFSFLDPQSILAAWEREMQEISTAYADMKRNRWVKDIIVRLCGILSLWLPVGGVLPSSVQKRQSGETHRAPGQMASLDGGTAYLLTVHLIQQTNTNLTFFNAF
jgi:hypothetical protein